MAVSTLAVRCRSAVERDGYRREIELIPEAEAPARLALVLLRLYNALGAIGLDDLTCWQLVTKCALDSMPALRRSVLEDLIARGNGSSATTEIAGRIGYPTTTTRRALEDLVAHGIADRQIQGQGQADLWQVSDWTRGRWPTVPEKSGEMRSDNGSDGSNLASPLPVRAFDDFSGIPADGLWPRWRSRNQTRPRRGAPPPVPSSVHDRPTGTTYGCRSTVPPILRVSSVRTDNPGQKE